MMRYKFDLPMGHFLFDAPLLRTPVGSLHVDLSAVKLLRLQRRNSFRTPVPEVMGISFILRKKNKKPHILICRVMDLSASGLAILTSDGNFQAGDELEGLLKCPHKDDVILSGLVRYSGELPRLQPPGSVHKVGLELINLSQDLSQHLLSIGLQIHRDTKNR
jgi:c-di-GMP-binding flagellar brake protein YcgR